MANFYSFAGKRFIMRGSFLIFPVMLLLVFSCGRRGSGPAADGSFTIVTLHGPSAMGMIWMIDSLAGSKAKTLHTHAPTLRVEIVAEPIQVRQRMLEGRADFAVLPLTMAAIIYNKGLNYRLLAIPVWGNLYLAGSDTTITGWEQLRHRTVHTMARGMTPDVLFRRLLQLHGIDPGREVNLDYSFPTHLDLANAMAAGRVSLAVLPEPQLSLVMKRNPAIRPLIDLNREWEETHGAAMTQTAFLVKSSVADEHPEFVAQVMHAYAASTRRVNESPDSAAPLIVLYKLLPDTAVARRSIPRLNLAFVQAATIRQPINDYLQVFYDMNPEIIGGKMPDEDFIY